MIKHVDKFRKHYLWRYYDITAKTPAKTVWEMVCLPKSKRGLGLVNPKTQNETLLLKYVHKFFNRADIP